MIHEVTTLFVVVICFRNVWEFISFIELGIKILKKKNRMIKRKKPVFRVCDNARLKQVC